MFAKTLILIDMIINIYFYQTSTCGPIRDSYGVYANYVTMFETHQIHK